MCKCENMQMPIWLQPVCGDSGVNCAQRINFRIFLTRQAPANANLRIPLSVSFGLFTFNYLKNIRLKIP
jgi:hypothetical protein